LGQNLTWIEWLLLAQSGRSSPADMNSGKDARAYTEPGAAEILVSNHAVAVNPVDRFNPSAGDLMFNWIKRSFWRRLRGLAAQRPIVRV
jgi:hypothetical protein